MVQDCVHNSSRLHCALMTGQTVNFFHFFYRMSAEQYAKRGHTIEIETKISTSRPVCIMAASSKAKSCVYHSIHINPMLFSFGSLSRKRMTSDSSAILFCDLSGRAFHSRGRGHTAPRRLRSEGLTAARVYSLCVAQLDSPSSVQ